MPKRKSVRKTRKKVAKKRAASRRPARAKRSATRRPARAKSSSRKSPARKAAPKSAAPGIRDGVITHTELASANPSATRDWCAKVLGWKFEQSMPTPVGPYHMWRFENRTGGGIRTNNPPEGPGSIPYCEVADIHRTYSRAIEAGATEMMAPEELPGGMGWIAIVAAPGGVPIGLWGMK